jgi:hypothetical protein
MKLYRQIWQFDLNFINHILVLSRIVSSFDAQTLFSPMQVDLCVTAGKGSASLMIFRVSARDRRLRAVQGGSITALILTTKESK